MKLDRYPAYRPSQIEWVKEVPVDWEECSAKSNFLMQLGKMLQNDPFGRDDIEVPYLKALHVNWNRVTTEDLPNMWASPTELEKYAVSNGDLLVCEGGEVGRAGIIRGLQESAIIQNALHRVRNSTMGDVRYFAYLLKHIADAGWFAVLCNKATIAHLTVNKLGAIYMPVPSLPEQQQIAAFLDWKTGQIDALIGRKQELLGKLKEKRIAVITQAVTQGLNPAALMRDSGIPCLGQVPQHWDVFKMSWVCTSIRDGTHNPPDRAAGIHRLLSVRNVQNGKFELLSDDRTMTPEDFAELQRSYTVEENDIVLAIVGATTGKSAIVGRLENVTVQRSLAVLRPDSSAISSAFLHYVMQSPVVQTEIALTVFKYSAQPGIYLDDVGRLPVVRPPLPEQATITAFLDAETDTIDALVTTVETAINRLTEYRRALISAATTGKIDVRNL